MARSRSFVLTLNNYTEEEFELLKELKYKYIIIGDEIGENGTPHLQGYVNFSNSTSFNTIKKACPRAHIEVAKGSPRQNYEYCSKQQIKYEDGTRPEPGKRKDIDKIKEYIETTDNPNMSDVIDSFATSLQSIRLAEVMLKYKEKPRQTKPKVEWYYGETGTGKTRQALEEYPNAYIKDNDNKWWEGYDSHETIVIDDLRHDTFPFNQLLRILDRYPNRLECKGGSRQNVAKQIIITSPYDPQQMFQERLHENIDQLIRRIDKIKMFT